MRLLAYDSNGDLQVSHDLGDSEVKPYAILSHTWGKDEDEVTYHEIGTPLSQQKSGYKKIELCGKQTRQDGWQHFWVDTCCINKANFTELSEAITSMYHWYQQAQVCYVYLVDVSSHPTATGHDWRASFRQSRWFTRGWTLQELLAPRNVVFYSEEWNRLGTKDELKELIYDITGISTAALEGCDLSNFPPIERMRWTRGRETKKKEDQAYCLLGIFGVSMSIRYGHGEGDNAFRRLQKKLDAQSYRQIAESTHDPNLPTPVGLYLGQASCIIPQQMDPVTLTTAAITFSTSIKNLVSVAKELATFCKHARKALAMLDSLTRELSLLTQILQGLDQVRQLAPEDKILKEAIANLSSNVVQLSSKVRFLLYKQPPQGTRTAWDLDTIQELIQDVNNAKTTALFTFNISGFLLSAQKFDSPALRRTDTNQLHSQCAVVMQKQLAVSSMTGQSTTLETTAEPRPVTVTPRQRKQARKRMLKFRFGPWIWDLAIQAVYGRWNYTLRVKRLFSLDPAIMQAIKSTDILTLDRMLSTNHVSPYDEDEKGNSLFYLAVGQSKDPIRMLQLILKYTDHSMEVESFASIMTYYMHPGVHSHLSRTYLTSLSRLMIEASDVDLLADTPDISKEMAFYPLSQWCSDVELFPFLRSRGSGPLLGQPADIVKLDVIYPGEYIAILYAYNIHPDHLDEVDQAIKDWLLWTLIHYLFDRRHTFLSHYAVPNIEESVVAILRAGASPTAVKPMSGLTPLQYGFAIAGFFNKFSGPILTAFRIKFILSSWLRCLARARIDLSEYILWEADATASLNKLGTLVSGNCYGYSIYYSGLSLLSKKIRIHLIAQWRVSIWTEVAPPGAWPRHKYHPERICWPPRAEDFLVTTWNKTAYVKSLNLHVDYSWLFSQSKDIYIVEPISDDHGTIARSFLRTRPVSRQRSASQPRPIKELVWKIQSSRHQPLLHDCHAPAFEPRRRLHYIGPTTDVPFTDELSACLHGRCEEDMWSMLTEGLRKYVGGWTLGKATDGVRIDDRWTSSTDAGKESWSTPDIRGDGTASYHVYTRL